MSTNTEKVSVFHLYEYNEMAWVNYMVESVRLQNI